MTQVLEDVKQDLATLDDADLDVMLQYLFGKHAAADKDDRLPIHLGIIAILAEQERRHDEWLAALPPVA